MKRILLALAVSALAFPVFAGTPVQVTDPAGVNQQSVNSQGQAAAATTGTDYASTEGSGTITSGGSFQTLFTASASRHGCLIENPTTASEPLYVYVGSGSPTIGSAFSLGPGASFNCFNGVIVVDDLIAVEAATTSHAFIAKSQ